MAAVVCGAFDDCPGVVVCAVRTDTFSNLRLEGTGIATRQRIGDGTEQLRALLFGPARLPSVNAVLALHAPTFPASVTREVPGAGRALLTLCSPPANLRPLGIVDQLGLRAMDPSGVGCVVSILLSKPITLSPRRRNLLVRLAGHIAAGWHLQRSCEQSVRLLRGKECLSALDPDDALALWQALVAGHWFLVERSEYRGRRCLLARRNSSGIPDLLGLNERERAVASCAALGHANKHIAYELGFGTSTVSVLLRSALRKLGLDERGELIRLFYAQPRSGTTVG